MGVTTLCDQWLPYLHSHSISLPVLEVQATVGCDAANVAVIGLKTALQEPVGDVTDTMGGHRRCRDGNSWRASHTSVKADSQKPRHPHEQSRLRDRVQEKNAH